MSGREEHNVDLTSIKGERIKERREVRSVGDGGKELSALEKIRSGLTCRKASHDEVTR